MDLKFLKGTESKYKEITDKSRDNFYQTEDNLYLGDLKLNNDPAAEEVHFTESQVRTNINSGDTISVAFGKIKKFFSDLKSIAFTGSYNDLVDLPAKYPDADKVDGYHASTTQAANTVVTRDSNGYIYTNYINSNTNASENPASIGSIIVTNTSDNFYRRATLAHVVSKLPVVTTTAQGVMSAADKTKLDGIAAGAQVNTVTGVKGNSETTYRTGNINITPANIGLGNVNNTADANKIVARANAVTTEAGTSDVDRYVYFANTSATDTEARLVWDADFKYNPATNTIKASSVLASNAIYTNYFMVYPGGGYYTYSGGQTGYLRITLPIGYTSIMMSFTVRIYNYVTQTSVDYHIGGYNYAGDSKWYNPTAICVGKYGGALSNLTVRFGDVSGKVAIQIGEASTSWFYPRIQISNVIWGNGTPNATSASGWNLAITTTAISNITQTVSSTHVGYDVPTKNLYDYYNGTLTKLAYSQAGLTTTSWVAAWNGYELRGIAPATLKTVMGLNNVNNTADASKTVAAANAINVVAANEIRFGGDAGTTPTLWFNYKLASGSNAATKLTQYIFGNGQNGYDTQLKCKSIMLNGTTAASNAVGSANPYLEFSNTDRSQYVQLQYTDYDSVMAPDSLTLIGNQSGSYFIAPNIKATIGFKAVTSAQSWIGGKTGTVPFDVTTQQTTSSYHPVLRIKSVSGNVWNIGGLGDSIGIYGYLSSRTANGTDWSTVWNTANGNITTTGSITASGFAGNATTATTLATARTINGTSFNGSANITTANWGTARNITIGGTTKSVNGSAAVSWSLSEIGAVAEQSRAVTIRSYDGDGVVSALSVFNSSTQSVINYIIDEYNITVTNVASELKVNTGVITYASGWSAHSTVYTPAVKRCGKMVFMTGAVKPSSALTASSVDTEFTMFTLPAGFRPANKVTLIQHGSLVNKFLLSIETTGAVKCSRYGTTANSNIPASAWMNITCSFIAA